MIKNESLISFIDDKIHHFWMDDIKNINKILNLTFKDFDIEIIRLSDLPYIVDRAIIRNDDKKIVALYENIQDWTVPNTDIFSDTFHDDNKGRKMSWNNWISGNRNDQKIMTYIIMGWMTDTDNIIDDYKKLNSK